MAHGFEEQDTGVYGSGKEPWHFAYTQNQVTVTEEMLDKLTVFTLSGLDWTVAPVKCFGQLADGTYAEVKDKRVMVREDTGRILGVVSDRYQPIQNKQYIDVMLDVFDAADLEFEAAFSIFGNRCVVFLAKLPGEVTVGGLQSEKHFTYLMATGWHDGSGCMEIVPSFMRVECANMRRMALSAGKNFTAKVAHIGDPKRRIAEIREAIGLTFEARGTALQQAEQLLDQKVTAAEVDAFLKGLIPAGNARSPELIAAGERKAANKRAEIKAVWENVPNLEPIRDSRYGALQAVSAYEGHYARAINLNGNSKDEYRFARVMGLSGPNYTGKAADLLLETADLTTLSDKSDDILRQAGFGPDTFRL